MGRESLPTRTKFEAYRGHNQGNGLSHHPQFWTSADKALEGINTWSNLILRGLRAIRFSLAKPRQIFLGPTARALLRARTTAGRAAGADAGPCPRD